MTQIEHLLAQWHGMQPIPANLQQELNRQFKIDFNYNSNHIEGNTLTYGQTKLLLMFGETTGNAAMRDWEEMKAHNVGLELTKKEAADGERPLTENFIRNLNKTILVEDFTRITHSPSGLPTPYTVRVGIYKTRPNSVLTPAGETFDYASPQETPALMTDLVAWYNRTAAAACLNPVELAALFHYRYIRIHPFEDGNGRVARLLVNFILARHRYPMIIVKSADKANYLHALHLCDVATDSAPSAGANAAPDAVRPLAEYLANLVKTTLEHNINAAKNALILVTN